MLVHDKSRGKRREETKRLAKSILHRTGSNELPHRTGKIEEEKEEVDEELDTALLNQLDSREELKTAGENRQTKVSEIAPHTDPVVPTVSTGPTAPTEHTETNDETSHAMQ